MLSLPGRPFRSSDGVTRRGLLQAGFLGVAGLSLADLARASAAAAATKPRDDLSVILIWLDGGPPQHETYDPKPDAPSDFRGPLKAISTRLPGVQVSELLPEHARMMDKMSIIRSMHHDNGDHFAAAHWMLTGYFGSNALNMAPMNPSAGSIIAKLRGPKRPGMPAYVGLPNTHSVGIKPGYHGGAYLGQSYSPFMAEGDPNAPGYSVTELTLPGGLDSARLDDRRGLLQAFDTARRFAEPRMGDIDRFNREAFAMLTGDAARRAFDLSKEDPRLRDRYGRHPWGQSALMAPQARRRGRAVRHAHLRRLGLSFEPGQGDAHDLARARSRGGNAGRRPQRAREARVDDGDRDGRIRPNPTDQSGASQRPDPRARPLGPGDERAPGRRRPAIGRRGRGLEPPGRNTQRSPGHPEGPAGDDLHKARNRPRPRLRRPCESADQRRPPPGVCPSKSCSDTDLPPLRDPFQVPDPRPNIPPASDHDTIQGPARTLKTRFLVSNLKAGFVPWFFDQDGGSRMVGPVDRSRSRPGLRQIRRRA